jgi:hypothetical protein
MRSTEASISAFDARRRTGEDRVAHDQRRLGRVQHDDRLALGCAAHGLDGLRGGLGELVDVGARAGAGALLEIEATISA